jgi:hypothetical protein
MRSKYDQIGAATRHSTFDSATLQSTQWIINAEYIQCSLQLLRDLTTKYEANTCLALLPAFGARTFSTVITTSVVQDFMKKLLALIV